MSGRSRQLLRRDVEHDSAFSGGKSPASGATFARGHSPAFPVIGQTTELDATLRNEMEGSFGHSFDHVRIHADTHADEAVRSVGADALTTGSDIFFGSGAWLPDSLQGRELLAHELTHVVQNSRFAAATDLDAVTTPGEPAEREASDAALAVVSGETASVSATPSAPIAPGIMRTLGDITGFTDRDKNAEPSFMKDVIGQTAWDFANDDLVGGLMGASGLANSGLVPAGGALAKAAPGINKVIGPLGLASGLSDVISGVTEDKPNFESREKIGTGALNMISGAADAAGLFGVGSEVTGATVIGSGLGAGGALAAGGQVAGAGLAGWEAGRLMDKGTGWLGGLMSGDKRSLTDRMADRSVGIDEWVTEKSGSGTLGSIAGYGSLGLQTVAAPAVALGELGYDAYKGISSLF